MVKLFEETLISDNRHSSKGNQLKWKNGDIWYKTDYAGYEGLAEYISSSLLQFSNLPPELYVLYETVQIQYKDVTYLGCKSKNFLPEGWDMITLERLFKNHFGESLNSSIYSIQELDKRIAFMVEQVSRITGIDNFGEYIRMMLTVDTLFLNEDRHTHNIAVLVDDRNKYHLCPIFDNGAGLLSDTTLDYPLSSDLFELMGQIKSKTFCSSFDDQLAVVELLYGPKIRFSFTKKDVENLLNDEPYYDKKIKKRVLDILTEQIRKYRYLFIN